MTTSGSNEASAWTSSEHARVKACAKALLLDESRLRPQLGRFELLRLLGRGAHGAVYAASDPQQREVVALKTLRKPNPGAIDSFKREFRSLAGIEHENLVQLHELFADGDEWYFTMELVTGVAFGAFAQSSTGRVDFAALKRVFASLASGVRAIHDAGKLHCDLKPSNVRVREDGRVVVLDYGLVTAGDAAVAGLAVLDAGSGTTGGGTPEYMAPELLAPGAAATRASDVYALGVMLWSALTGRLPFPGRTRAALLRKQIEDAPRARDSAHGIPAELDELCAGLLARDPLARPSLERLLSELGVSALEPERDRERSPSTRPTRAFVGRSTELAGLHAALDSVRVGQPVAVLVSGPSGIGKTALVEHFVERLAGRALLLAGRCYEREALPYKAFDGIIDALVRQLRVRSADELDALVPPHLNALLQVFPAMRRVPRFSPALDAHASANLPELRQQAFAALKVLLERLSRQRPLVMIADDLQWADLDSTWLLLELLGPPAAPALLYVGCYRKEDEEASEFLREVLAPRVFARRPWEQRAIALSALDRDASSALALQFLRGRIPEAESAALRIAEEAGGAPFFVGELARYVALEPNAASAPLSLNELLRSRISALQPRARHALCLLSLAARPLPEPVLKHALDSHERWQLGVRSLQSAGLVRADANGALVSSHDRVRELAAESVSPSEHATFHAALARAYEQAPHAEPEWLIEHWHKAGDRPRALQYAILAAESAGQKLAFHRSGALYRTALALLEPADARRTELYVQLGAALANAGRAKESAEAYLCAVEATSDADAALALRCLATQQHLRDDDIMGSLVLVERLLADVGVTLPSGSIDLGARIVWQRLRATFSQLWPRRNATRSPARQRRIQVLRSVFREIAVTDPMNGLLLQQMFYADALRSDDLDAVFVGVAWDTYTRAFLAGARGARGNGKRLARLERLADELQSPYALATAGLMRTAAALYEGKYTEVEAPAAAAQVVFGEHCVGALWEESVCTALRYTAIEIAGPIRRLLEDVPALVRRADERGDRFSDATIAMAMTLAQLADDQPEAASSVIERWRQQIPDGLNLPRLFLKNRLMDWLRYSARSAEAWHDLEEIWEGYMRGPYRRLELTRIMMHHQRARCAVAACAERWDEGIARIAEREAAIVGRIGRPESRAMEAATLAALAWQRGRRELAHQKLAEAAREAERATIFAYAACYRRQLGRVIGGSEGAELVAATDIELRAQGVRSPARWVEIYAPGFPERG